MRLGEKKVSRMYLSHRALEVLSSNNIPYTLIRHRESSSSNSTAIASLIPRNQIVKAVVLKGHKQKLLMALLAADQKVNLTNLNRVMNDRFNLLKEEELDSVFHKCKPGAIVPIADAVYMDSIVEQGLTELQEVYMEAGDHINLIHIDSVGFRKLIGEARKAHFAHLDRLH